MSVYGINGTLAISAGVGCLEANRFEYRSPFLSYTEEENQVVYRVPFVGLIPVLQQEGFGQRWSSWPTTKTVLDMNLLAKMAITQLQLFGPQLRQLFVWLRCSDFIEIVDNLDIYPTPNELVLFNELASLLFTPNVSAAASSTLVGSMVVGLEHLTIKSANSWISIKALSPSGGGVVSIQTLELNTKPPSEQTIYCPLFNIRRLVIHANVLSAIKSDSFKWEQIETLVFLDNGRGNRGGILKKNQRTILKAIINQYATQARTVIICPTLFGVKTMDLSKLFVTCPQITTLDIGFHVLLNPSLNLSNLLAINCAASGQTFHAPCVHLQALAAPIDRATTTMSRLPPVVPTHEILELGVPDLSYLTQFSPMSLQHIRSLVINLNYTIGIGQPLAPSEPIVMTDLLDHNNFQPIQSAIKNLVITGHPRQPESIKKVDDWAKRKKNPKLRAIATVPRLIIRPQLWPSLQRFDYQTSDELTDNLPENSFVDTTNTTLTYLGLNYQPNLISLLKKYPNLTTLKLYRVPIDQVHEIRDLLLLPSLSKSLVHLTVYFRLSPKKTTSLPSSSHHETEMDRLCQVINHQTQLLTIDSNYKALRLYSIKVPILRILFNQLPVNQDIMPQDLYNYLKTMRPKLLQRFPIF